MANKQNNSSTGNLGESITTQYLKDRDYQIIGRNYYKKWGEIDVIALKNNRIHFVEVKTVTHETREHLEQSVSYGTFRPEENVHQRKLFKLGQIIETWISEHEYQGDWQIDVAAVRIVSDDNYAVVNMIENVIRE